jgi:hypothetical protein
MNYLKSLFLCLSFLVVTSTALAGGSPEEVGNHDVPTCLVGTYDLREGNTLIHVINATQKDVVISVFFLDDEENPITCLKYMLSPNDLQEIDVAGSGVDAKLGVFKIYSLIDEKQAGAITGFQQKLLRSGSTESNLASVPGQGYNADLKLFERLCQ